MLKNNSFLSSTRPNGYAKQVTTLKSTSQYLLKDLKIFNFNESLTKVNLQSELPVNTGKVKIKH